MRTTPSHAYYVKYRLHGNFDEVKGIQVPARQAHDIQSCVYRKRKEADREGKPESYMDAHTCRPVGAEMQ